MSRVQPHLPGAARAGGAPGVARHHRRAARPTSRGHVARGPPLRGDPARRRHPGGVGARPRRRLPARARGSPAAAAVRVGRGAGAGDGRARRSARRRRSRRSGRAGARQAPRLPSPARSPRRRRRSGVRRRRCRSATPSRPDPATTVALVEACAARRRVRLGYRHRGRRRPRSRRRPVGGRGALRPVVPPVPLGDGRRRAHLPDRPGGVGEPGWRRRSSRPRTSTRSRCSRSTSAPAGSYPVEVLVEAPLERVRAAIPRTHGPARGGRRRTPPGWWARPATSRRTPSSSAMLPGAVPRRRGRGGAGRARGARGPAHAGQRDAGGSVRTRSARSVVAGTPR